VPALAHPLAGPPPEEPTDWMGYRRALVRYRWWVLALALAGTLGGAAASRFLPPNYLGEATIWVQTTDTRGAPDRGPLGASQLLGAAAWAELVKSYVVLDQVVRDQGLYLQRRRSDAAAFAHFAVRDPFRPGRYRLRVDREHSSYALEADPEGRLESGRLGDPIGAALGFDWRPAADALAATGDIKFTVLSSRDASKKLAEVVKVSVDPSGNFLRVSLPDADGQAAAATVNAIVERFVAVATELRRAKLTALAQLLGQQLKGAEDNLHRSEGALASFRERTITLPSDPSLPTAAATVASGVTRTAVSEYFAQRFEREEAQSDGAAIMQALSAQRDSGGSIDALARIGAVQRSPDLSAAFRDLTGKRAEQRALLGRYTSDHPAVRRVVGDIATLEHETIPALARSLAADLAARERLLSSQLGAGARELTQIPQRTIEEARLRRNVTIAEELFATVQQRYNEARLAEASSIADVRVLDAAIAPQRPVRDTASRLIALGFLVGLGFGVVGSVLMDRLDRRVRYPDQVTNGMGLRILGALPHVKNKKAGPDDEQVMQVIETMRSVRLSLLHAYGTAGPMVITITSPGVGDGKSFVSTNLALACAQAGQRTLLVDGDTRRGALHRVLGGVRKPGLTDVLAGRVPLEAVKQVLDYKSLHFLGAGSRVRESPELLGSPAMVDLLVRLRGDYQVILVDSPPLGAGVDPYTLGTLTGAMMLVLRTGTTNLELARTRLAMLEQLPIRLLGVLLNDVQPGEMYGYYSYTYAGGYAAVDEGSGTQVARRRMQGVL